MMTAEKLKASVLQMAMQGKLVEQRPEEGTGEDLYKEIQIEKKKLLKEGKIKKQKPLPEIKEEELPFDIPESWRWVKLGDISSYAQPKEKVGPKDITPEMWSLDLEDIEKGTGKVLNHVLASSLKLLHPFMPFITSEIYSNIIVFGTKDLIVAKWPDIREKFAFDDEEEFIEKIKKLIVEIRNVRTKMNVHPSKKSKMIIVSSNNDEKIMEIKDSLLKLGFASEIVIQKDEGEIPENAISIVIDDIKVFLPFEDLVDIKEEIERLTKEKKRLESEVLRGEKMLSNPGFINKAPEAKINEERDKLDNYRTMLEAVKENLKKFDK